MRCFRRFDLPGSALLGIALTLDPQTRVENDELITFVETLDLGSRRGLPGFVPGRMSGLPRNFALSKLPNGGVERPAGIKAQFVALIIGQAMCMIIRAFHNLGRR